jgi:hypothetical protein
LHLVAWRGFEKSHGMHPQLRQKEQRRQALYLHYVLALFLKNHRKAYWFDGINKHGAPGYSKRMATLKEDFLSEGYIIGHRFFSNSSMFLFITL